jgi:uncharacterized membrane protein YjfL (UPF0719 family)
MNWLKSKFFWLNLIAIIIMIIQYLIDNNSLPDYAKWEVLGIVILNAIAGMIQSAEVAKLKAKLSKR